jgi:hypothetical protein
MKLEVKNKISSGIANFSCYTRTAASLITQCKE